MITVGIVTQKAGGEGFFLITARVKSVIHDTHSCAACTATLFKHVYAVSFKWWQNTSNHVSIECDI